ncbi:hypothetical protein FGO68_gene15819 [Halteria grandinella]|uniref:Uncharacterized protein n=1 Tax=Halteria grandinella TaxID=5974 RepID=A0A8J8SWG8_HALGN|nr:hypothetical protein FGO68_gene15819 [Halteria grandinella]
MFYNIVSTNLLITKSVDVINLQYRNADIIHILRLQTSQLAIQFIKEALYHLIPNLIQSKTPRISTSRQKYSHNFKAIRLPFLITLWLVNTMTITIMLYQERKGENKLQEEFLKEAVRVHGGQYYMTKLWSVRER